MQHRNQILGLWSKDVSRILPLSDCGVTDTASTDEPSRASLIREIYAFLDQSVSFLKYIMLCCIVVLFSLGKIVVELIIHLGTLY